MKLLTVITMKQTVQVGLQLNTLPTPQLERIIVNSNVTMACVFPGARCVMDDMIVVTEKMNSGTTVMTMVLVTMVITRQPFLELPPQAQKVGTGTVAFCDLRIHRPSTCHFLNWTFGDSRRPFICFSTADPKDATLTWKID